MLTLVPEDTRRRDAQKVRDYLKGHRTDHYCLFASAYFIHHGMLDKWNVQSDVDRFKVAEETPDYLVLYLSRRQN